MQDTKGLLNDIKQHGKIAIRVSSNSNNNLSEEVMQMLIQPHRKANYFFVFMENGSLTHKADLNDLTITNGQLFFVLPNQIHSVPAQKKDDIECFKMSFDENCLSLLPKQFSFLINPLNSQIISFENDARQRVKILFEILNQILNSDDDQKDAEIILAHLNALLTELNNAYFKNAVKGKAEPNKIQKYIEFRIAVEAHLTEQYSINTIADNLSVTTNHLYNIVKEFSGVSPKEFITNRLILEAQRKLHYSKTTIKELAYELGFNDPDYFSRLFKKSTGKSISTYLTDIQDLSGH
ncbi:helix-turn-helix domain-containing protein [Chryseobacterium soli]|uniref:AraC family transcriptional regulator n=1 Tax=Chryseobacterium soli TaxID=445961 RepID=UPI0029548AE6|nr:helix-turn-helix domain-containing protein [Chryseobacterium soli]MDV7697968.1 helix-turn-helix domain-containing protein [Chryseobacterium soli]